MLFQDSLPGSLLHFIGGPMSERHHHEFWQNFDSVSRFGWRAGRVGASVGEYLEVGACG